MKPLGPKDSELNATHKVINVLMSATNLIYLKSRESHKMNILMHIYTKLCKSLIFHPINFKIHASDKRHNHSRREQFVESN